MCKVFVLLNKAIIFIFFFALLAAVAVVVAKAL